MFSGIAPLDERMGGVSPGRLHLLTGGPGAGKTTACLHFIQAGLQQRQSAVLITQDEPADLTSHAHALGFDLPAPVRDNRVLLIRYRSEFATRLSSATLIDPIIDELRRLIGWVLPARLVIDPLVPFVNESPSGALLTALVQWLERVGATTLLTWPGSVAQGHDARLDLVVQRAATITHFARSETGVHSLHVVQSRVSAAPAGVVPFLIKPGAGMVLPEPEPAAVAQLAEPVTRARRGKRAPLEIAQTS